MFAFSESFSNLQPTTTEYQEILDNKLECLLQRIKSFLLLYVQIFILLKRTGIINRPLKKPVINPKNEFQSPRQDFFFFLRCINSDMYIGQTLGYNGYSFQKVGKFTSKSHSHPLAPVLTHTYEADEVTGLLNSLRVLSLISEDDTSSCDFLYKED